MTAGVYNKDRITCEAKQQYTTSEHNIAAMPKYSPTDDSYGLDRRDLLPTAPSLNVKRVLGDRDMTTRSATFAAVCMVLALSLVSAGLDPAGARAETGAASGPRTITLTATGYVSGVPDIAQVSTGVISEAKTATAALEANKSAMAKVIAALKKSAIAAKDMQTTTITVSPRYSSYRSASGRTITGYRVQNQVRFSTKDVDALGAVLDKAVAAGANALNSISFAISNADTLLDEARKDAMQTAFRKAALYAAAAKATLGEVLKIDETVQRTAPVARYRQASASSPPVPIEKGTQSLSVRVRVTFSLKK